MGIEADDGPRVAKQDHMIRAGIFILFQEVSRLKVQPWDVTKAEDENYQEGTREQPKSSQ